LLILPILMPAPDEVARLAVPREQGIGGYPRRAGSVRLSILSTRLLKQIVVKIIARSELARYLQIN